jgi:acyl-CoA reductase-like NAD-dependent aldehyde dehydrogenase
MELNSWRNRSPGDLSVLLPEIIAGDPAEAVDAAKIAATAWAKTPLAERSERLQRVQRMLDATRERLAEHRRCERLPGGAFGAGRPACRLGAAQATRTGGGDRTV